MEEISHNISRNPAKAMSSMNITMTRDITPILCGYNLPTSINRTPVGQAAIVMLSVMLLGET
jgi:hypothetical protein